MKLTRRILAVLLAVTMTFSQSGAVFAAESVSQPGPTVNVEDTTSQNAGAETGGVWKTEGEMPEGQEADQNVSENDAVVLPDAVPETPVTDPEETAGEQVSENEAAGIVSENNTNADDLPYGLKGMPEGFTISEKQLKVKKDLASHEVVKTMDSMRAGEDYVEDEVIFSCEDPEYAKLVAEAYNGTLKSCRYGVAVIKIDTAKLTVKEAVEAGSDVMNALPPVEANYLTKLDDPVKSAADPASGLLSGSRALAAKKNAVDARDWSYWKNSFKDPALDPGYIAYDPFAKIDKNMYQWMHDAINTYAAWGVTQGEGVTVAVIDGGVYAEHPDLKGRVVERKVVTDFTPVDINGHGTHVAGIIAEVQNDVGGVGVAPKAKIIDLPIFNENGGCSGADEARAIYYAAHGDDGKVQAQVINMSLGGPGYNATVQEKLTDARERGVIACIAMGNEHTSNISYPAACDDVVAVSAIDESWQKSDFSTYGDWADIASPGTAIYSTWNGHTENNTTTDYNYYISWDGTSMATPVVAGVCALYISAAKATGKDPTPDEVEAALKKTATKISSSYKIGAGVVNAAAMLQTLEGTGKPSVSVPSSLSFNSTITFADNGEAGGTLGYIYTVNGKKPSAAAGEVKEGFYVEAVNGKVTVTVEDLVDNGLELNTASKLMVGRVTGLGTLTDIAEESITVEGNASTGMKIVGTDYIGKGKGVTYTLNRKLPKNNPVTWSLEGAPAGVTINKKTGKVTTKNTSTGEFTIVAEIAEGKASKWVKLVDPATSVSLKAGSADKTVNMPVTDKNGNIKSARLFNVDIPKTDKLTENVLQLTGTVNGRSEQTDDVEYISSKKSIATVDAKGNVTAHKAGTVKITCRAKDGSNKQAAVTIKVIVPVSKLDMFAMNGQQGVAFGKSIKFKPAIGSAYGKPTVKKVEWTKEPVRVMAYSGGGWTDVTSTVKNGNLIKINNGTVTVNKKMSELGTQLFECTIRLSATDGSGQTLEKSFYVSRPTTKIKYLKHKEYTGGDFEVFFESDSLYQPLVTGNNTKIGSAELYDFGKGQGTVLVIRKRDKDGNPVGKGTLTVTVKAVDGTNVKYTFRIRWK